MAPATIAGAALRARPGRGAGWDRDSIIIAIQEWVATYGEPPRAADWNPSSLGARVAACAGSEPFGTPTDKLTGI